MKLWEKGASVDALMEWFTVGMDREMDQQLARWDVVGSIAHVTMLGKVGLLRADEAKILTDTLTQILREIDDHQFVIDPSMEDVHSQIEYMLIQRLGELGKKIHLGRSRNDQVAVDMKLYLRHELSTIRSAALDVANVLLTLAERHSAVLLPGYTHTQVAMPSSFGLWFGGYAEAVIEDVRVLDVAIDAANANPLGSAAGYGSSVPIDRQATTELLDFERVHVTSTFAQMSRGRTERICAMAIGNLAATLSRFAADVVWYMSQNQGFVSLPDAYTTGSSIMPHKKNPDVFEVLRARCNRLQALPNELSMMQANATSGYHRDLQFMKDRIIPAITEMQHCLQVLHHVAPHLEPRQNILESDVYRYLFSVDRVNALVMEGMAFRDAYRAVAAEIEQGSFTPPTKDSVGQPGHLGSITNPGLDLLRERLNAARTTSQRSAR